MYGSPDTRLFLAYNGLEDAGAEAPEAAEAPASKSFKGFGEKPKKVVKQKTKAQLEVSHRMSSTAVWTAFFVFVHTVAQIRPPYLALKVSVEEV